MDLQIDAVDTNIDRHIVFMQDREDATFAATGAMTGDAARRRLKMH